MKTPFGPPLDVNKLFDYISTHSPDEMAIDSRNWQCDPTDLLTIADILRRHNIDDFALALYKEGLQRLEDKPNQIAPDTNLGGAYSFFGELLEKKFRFQEALEAFSKAFDAGADDPFVKTHLAVNLHGAGRFEEALKHIDDVLQQPIEELAKWLPPEHIQVAKDLQAEILKQLNKHKGQFNATLADLYWWHEPDEVIPEAIYRLPLSTLKEKGINQDLVNSLKSAVILSISTDRKVCCVAFYDIQDPSKIAQRGDMGKFQIWFYLNPQDGSIRSFSVKGMRH